MSKTKAGLGHRELFERFRAGMLFTAELAQ
jgi:hypothetical protein